MRRRFAGPHAKALWSDPWLGLDRLLAGGGMALLWTFVGLTAGWWVYVPLHELMHAAGCLLSGGTVTRLEIDALYDGALLAKALPFVVPAGEYAGRLSGFDTGGSDLVYLATDLAPYLLTLWPGFWALRRAAVSRHPWRFGFWLPWALAPIVSLSGDAYEIGSLLVRQLPPWRSPAPAAAQLVGDDLIRKAAELGSLGSAAPWVGFALAAAIGAAWAWTWVALASRVASWLGESPLSSRPADGRVAAGA
ncbi:MAG: hypothetical protein IPJ17_15240 [Holophagales bacterium]|nr:MAG: hypothetical protein IPJ17_15240 [Holophagales bacterium]